MIGDDPRIFRLPTSDTVSLLNEDEAALPFCGKLRFTLFGNPDQTEIQLIGGNAPEDYQADL